MKKVKKYTEVKEAINDYIDRYNELSKFKELDYKLILKYEDDGSYLIKSEAHINDDEDEGSLSDFITSLFK